MKRTQYIRSIIAVAMTWTALSTLAADNTPNAQQAAGGWRSLFDGRTLDGWTVRSGFATYTVDNGTIVGATAKGSPNTFLVTTREFSDFELTFDVKLESDLNSGVQIRSRLKDDPKFGTQYVGRVYGPQVEIERGPGQAGFVYGEASGGWLSPEPASKDTSVNAHSHFKNDDWNRYRIRAQGRHIETWINDNKVADLTLSEDKYNENPSGFIGLQVHGVRGDETMRVRWKNLFIKELDTTKTP